jgi:uncharacterized protein (DUF433 family)
LAELYGLSVQEFAYILTTFPLLDRDHPPLPGDLIIRWGAKGRAKPEPRSYITRDLALLIFMRRKGATPPKDLVGFYREEVEIDLEAEQSPFRLGPIRDLEVRVEEATRRGAIAYVPSRARRFDPAGPYRPPDLPANWEDVIVGDPQICGGAPTLKGTRIEVALVASLLDQGRTFAEILASYPHLTPAQVATALEWFRTHKMTRDRWRPKRP